MVIFVETERGRGRGEESYSCTATTPDGGIAKGSAKSTRLLELAGASVHGEERLGVALGQARGPPEVARRVVDRAVHVRHGRVCDVPDTQVVSELVNHQSPVFARVVDARRDDPDAPALRERHVPRPLRIPRLQLIRAVEFLDDEVLPPGRKA